MSDERPILEYRSSAASTRPAGAPGGDRTFTFAPPPVIADLVVQGIVVVVFTGVAIGLSVMAVQALRQAWSWQTMLLCVLGITVCMMIASSNWRHLRNGMRFGGLPVKLTIANDHLIMANPRQWGLKVVPVPLTEIRRCYAVFAGWSPMVRTIYRVSVETRRRGTIELSVASADAAAVNEAVAGINSRLPSAAAAK
jgi:hypothetical protein